MIENTRTALKELPLAEKVARCGKVCKELSHLLAIKNQSIRTLQSPPPIGDSPAAMAGHFNGVRHRPTAIKGLQSFLGGSGSAHKTAASCPVSTTVDTCDLADLFIQYVFRLHGLPQTITSYQGPQLPLHSGIVSIHDWELNCGCLPFSIHRPMVRPNE